MPVVVGRDSKGAFYRWGIRGKKYYYDPNDNISRAKAKKKAQKQGIAITINKVFKR